MKGLVDETEAKKGADGKRCWKGKRYAGTENGKDKCIPVKNESAYEKDLQDHEPRTVQGVYGVKSKPFTKKFKNQAHQDRFFDHPDREGNYEIQYVQKVDEAANPAQQAAIAINKKKKANEGILNRFKKTDKKDSMRDKLSQMSTDELRQELKDYAPRVSSARASGSLVGGAVADYVNTIKTEIDKRAFNDFTEKNPDWDKGMNEGVIVGHDANDPEVAILGGAGTMSLSRLKKKAHQEALQLADDIANGKYSASSYNMKQLHNTLNTIVAAEKEMETSYFGEARSPHPLLKAANKNLVDLASGEVRRREEARKKADRAQKAASKYLASLDKPKAKSKQDLAILWQKIEDVIANSFPDGDPYDTLWPYMQKNGFTQDDVERASKMNGYNDLWDYWNALTQDVENDAYQDWLSTGGKNVRTRGQFVREMPDTSGPVGTQPGGWRRTDMEEAKKSEFRQEVERQQNEKLEKINNSTLPQWAKEYLIMINDPKGKVFKAGYSSFPKGQEARHEAMQYIMNKYKVPQEWMDKVNLLKGMHVTMDREEDRHFNWDLPSMHEDTAFASGMGQGHGGESYRKFKPKSAGTFKESAIMKGLKRESK